MDEPEVVETEQAIEGAEAEAAEPEIAGEPGQETPPEETTPPEEPPPADPVDERLRELEELRAERQRNAPLIEYAQHALRASMQQRSAPAPQPTPGPDPVVEAFRLLWEPAAAEEERVQREAAFKQLPANVRSAAVQRFHAAQQEEFERARDPEAYYTRKLEPLIDRLVQERTRDMVVERQMAEFNRAFPDLANDQGYAEVERIMATEGAPWRVAAELALSRRGRAAAAEREKSQSAAAADSKAVLDARRGKAAARPNLTGRPEKPIKRSGHTFEDAMRDVTEYLAGQE